jgi:hypothetical protein
MSILAGSYASEVERVHDARSIPAAAATIASLPNPVDFMIVTLFLAARSLTFARGLDLTQIKPREPGASRWAKPQTFNPDQEPGTLPGAS